jgi:hypothetical protein
MSLQAQLYDDALTILDALFEVEDDFDHAARLNAVMVELAVLKHAPRQRLPQIDAHRRDWLASLDYWDKHSM